MSLRPLYPLSAVLGVVGLLLCAGAHAQGRQLDYELLSVQARLTAEGALEIDEWHWLVMSGDWNGAERRFRLERGHSMELVRVTRWDPETRSEIPMTRDPRVRAVNSWAYSDQTFRMRARLPQDPPLRDEIVAYRLAYRLDGVLRENRAGGYELDHDFAFGDRSGSIRRFNLQLELDPAWQSSEPSPIEAEVTDLAVGSGYEVELLLEPVGEALVGVAAGGARDQEGFFESVFVTLLVLLAAGMAWIRRAQPERFEKAPQAPERNEEQRVLRQLRKQWTPEQCAVLWPRGGDTVGNALILRLIHEGRIELLSDSDGGAERLRWKGDRKGDSEAIAVLVDRLFLGETEIRLSTLRSHYRKTGFDLSKFVQPSVEEGLDVEVRDRFGEPLRSNALGWVPWAVTVLLLGAVLLSVGEILSTGAGLEVLADLLVISLLAGAVQMPTLWLTSFAVRRVFGVRLWAWAFSVLAVPPLYVVALVDFVYRAGWVLAGAHLCLGVAMLLWMIRRFHGRQGRGFARASLDLALAEAALRSRLERGWGLREWQQPYAGAFGLFEGKREWSRITTEVDPDDPLHRRRDLTIGGSLGSSGTAPATSAGGGAFGGAGASGAWAAVSSFSSVSGPASTSGSSSGSSSSSSSGGGGGGGW